MTPVFQTKFGKDGNCAQAVVASLMDLPLEAVPYFDPSDGSKFWRQVQEFLAPQGLALFTVHGFIGGCVFGADDELYHWMSGPSPNFPGLYHAVVGDSCGGVAHDPNPSGKGLAGGPEGWQHHFIVRR